MCRFGLNIRSHRWSVCHLHNINWALLTTDDDWRLTKCVYTYDIHDTIILLLCEYSWSWFYSADNQRRKCPVLLVFSPFLPFLPFYPFFSGLIRFSLDRLQPVKLTAYFCRNRFPVHACWVSKILFCSHHSFEWRRLYLVVGNHGIYLYSLDY